MLTTFLTVTNTDDSGPGSLREAILSANSAAEDVTIQFAIPASDPHFEDVDSALPGGDGDPDAFVISPLSPLPDLNNPDYVVTVETATGDGMLQLNLTDETAIAAATGIDRSLTRRGPFEGKAYVLHTTREDVNLDFAVTPEDALVLINWLNSHGRVIDPDVRPEPRAVLYDVNEDGWITPLDALRVIAFLMRHSSPRGEGEAAGEQKSLPVMASESVFATEPSWLPAAVQTGRTPTAGHSPASSPRGTLDPGPWTRRVDPLARQAGGESPFSWPWADATASLVAGSLAWLSQDRSQAVEGLQRAYDKYHEAGMPLFASAVGLRLGKLLGASRGERLVADGKSWLAEQGIPAPDSVAAALVPGFDGTSA